MPNTNAARAGIMAKFDIGKTEKIMANTDAINARMVNSFFILIHLVF